MLCNVYAFLGTTSGKWFYDCSSETSFIEPLISEYYLFDIDSNINDHLFDAIRKAIADSKTNLTKSNLKFIWHLHKSKILNEAM